MRTTPIVFIAVSVLAVSSIALAGRTDSRAQEWEREADRGGKLVLPALDLLGPSDDLVPVYGTEGNDVIGGTPGEDHIRALGGEDDISGAGANDIIEAGAGDDTVNGQAGDDYLRGQTGDDDVIGDIGDDYLMGGPGNDVLMPGPGNDVALCGQGMDEAHYYKDDNSTSSDYYDGGPGYDLITIHVPGDFSTMDRDEILNQFSMSGGSMYLGTWGMELNIVDFEDMVIDIAPPEPARKDGQGEPLATRAATWGSIKALYR
jgi:hypothetical protein